MPSFSVNVPQNLLDECVEGYGWKAKVRRGIPPEVDPDNPAKIKEGTGISFDIDNPVSKDDYMRQLFGQFVAQGVERRRRKLAEEEGEKARKEILKTAEAVKVS